MKWFRYKYKLTRDEEGNYWIYRKRLFLWVCVTCAVDYERALKKIKFLEFLEYFDEIKYNGIP